METKIKGVMADSTRLVLWKFFIRLKRSALMMCQQALKNSNCKVVWSRGFVSGHGEDDFFNLLLSELS